MSLLAPKQDPHGICVHVQSCLRYFNRIAEEFNKGANYQGLPVGFRDKRDVFVRWASEFRADLPGTDTRSLEYALQNHAYHYCVIVAQLRRLSFSLKDFSELIHEQHFYNDGPVPPEGVGVYAILYVAKNLVDSIAEVVAENFTQDRFLALLPNGGGADGRVCLGHLKREQNHKESESIIYKN